MHLFRYLLVFIFIAVGTGLFAQNNINTEKFEVSGNCAMCKKRIETAGKDAGAKSIEWDSSTGIATVTYDSSKNSLDKIKQGIAEAGHDTKEFRAPDATYEELHECCLYPRMDAEHEHDHDHDLAEEGHQHEVAQEHKPDGDVGHDHDHDHEVTGVVVNESEKGHLNPITEVTICWVDNPSKKVKPNENGV